MKADPGKKLGAVKRRSGRVEPQSPIVGVLAAKNSAEISIRQAG